MSSLNMLIEPNKANKTAIKMASNVRAKKTQNSAKIWEEKNTHTQTHSFIEVNDILEWNISRWSGEMKRQAVNKGINKLCHHFYIVNRRFLLHITDPHRERERWSAHIERRSFINCGNQKSAEIEACTGKKRQKFVYRCDEKRLFFSNKNWTNTNTFINKLMLELLFNRSQKN